MGKITKKVEEQDLTALKEGTTLQSEKRGYTDYADCTHHSVDDEAIDEGITFSSRPD